MQYLRRYLNSEAPGNSGGGNSVDDFMKVITQPAQPAVDTQQQAQDTAIHDSHTNDWAKPEEKTEQPAPFVFPAEETEATPVTQAARKEAQDYKTKVLKDFITCRSSLQALGLAKVALTQNNSLFKYTDAEIAVLMEAWEPYADDIAKYFPKWMLLVTMEATITGTKITEALALRKQEITNREALAQMQANPATTAAQPAGANMQAAVHKVVPFAPAPAAQAGNAERTRFEIHGNGYYQYPATPGGAYLKQEYATQKPNLSNKEEMQHVINKNGWKKAQKIFNLPDNFRQQIGMVEEGE